MRFCCELCGNVATNTYKTWLEHLTSEIHQELTQRDVWTWEEEANLRSLAITGMPNEGGKFQEVNLSLIVVAWHFSKYGIISNIFVHPNQKFFIVQFEKRELTHIALTTDPCEIQGVAVILRIKQDLSPSDWFTLSSCSTNNDVITDAAPDDLLEAKQLWYSEQMLNLQADMQLEKFISLATMSASDFSNREKIRSDLSLLIKREYGNAQLQGLGDVITGLGDSESTLIVHIDVLGASRNPLQHKHDDWYSPTSYVDAIYRMMVSSSKSSEPFCQDVVLNKQESEYISLTHYPSNINVELQFESVIPVYSSKLIQFLISLDPRVLPLMLIIRYWAAYHIQPTNSISTYALELLIVTFLNSCKILPNVAFLQSKTTNKIPVVDNFWNVNFCADYEEITKILAHSGKTPVEYSETTRKPTASSILLLASNFFKMYAAANFKNNIVCSLLGNLLSKDGFYVDNPNATLPLLLQPYKNWALSKDSTLDIDSPICVQDPFNLGKNVASTVTMIDLEKFQNACYTSIALFERLAKDATGVLQNFMGFASRKHSNENESRNNGTPRKRPWQWQRASEISTGKNVEDDEVQIVTFVNRSKSPNINIPARNNFRKDPAFENQPTNNNSKSTPLLPTPEINMPTRINFREEQPFENRPSGNFSNRPKPLLPLPEMNMQRHTNFREDTIFENRHISNYSERDLPPERDFSVPNRFQQEPIIENRLENDNYTKPSPLLPYPRRPNRDEPPEKILRNPGDYRNPVEAKISSPQTMTRFLPDCSIVREVQNPIFRSQKYNAGRQHPHTHNINSPSLHLDNNRSPMPAMMDGYRHNQEDHQFQRGSRDRSVSDPFQNQRMGGLRGGGEALHFENSRPPIPALMEEYRHNPEDHQFERGHRDRSMSRIEREPFQNQRMESGRRGRESLNSQALHVENNRPPIPSLMDEYRDNQEDHQFERESSDRSVTRIEREPFRNQRMEVGRKGRESHNSLENNRSPIPALMHDYRHNQDHQFERGSRDRPVTVIDRESFQNQRMEVGRGGRESHNSLENHRSPIRALMDDYPHNQVDHQFERGSRDRSVTRIEREPMRGGREIFNSPNHPREHSGGSGAKSSSPSPRTISSKRRNRKEKRQLHKHLEEAVPVDGLETYELRIQHKVAPNFSSCFNFMFSNLAREMEVEQKCTSLWSVFLKDYFTEIWETAFKLTAKICDPTIILDKLYSNRPNLQIRDSYSERDLQGLHKIRTNKDEDDDDEDGRDLISSLCNRPQNGYFRDRHPHQDKFAQINYHEKFCISFLVGGCTEIFTAHALRHQARRELRGRMWDLSPLEKEGLVNQYVLERMRQEKTYREFIATAKVDLTTRPPQLLTIFTETPDCPGMEEVFDNMTDIMKRCLSQYQNSRLERWLL